MTKTKLFSIVCILALSCLCISVSVVSQNEITELGSFSSQGMKGWEVVEFGAQTRYQLVEDEGVRVLQSLSENSASGLVYKEKINIKKYPYINWRWQVKTKFDPLNELTKEGDDYVARLYVMASDGWFFWNTKALNYVWSSQTLRGISWPNAYAPDNTKMLALRTSEDVVGTWYVEKRNIYQDLKQWLGKEIIEIEAIAIMTDSDDSGGRASANYGDIYFSSE
jgi:hypothetical protein